MLSNDCIQLLRWINGQKEPVPLAKMQELHAPGFSEQRVEQLRKDKILSWTYVTYDGELVAGYILSDNGKAALEQLDNIADQARQQAADKRTDRKFQILYILLGALLTLLIEHGPAILHYLHSMFR